MSARIERVPHENIPHLLTEIPQPPKQLYLRGVLPSYELRWLAVVGSRKHSHYGKDVCEHLIRGLAGYPVVIVSGLALGIDAIAHRTALEVGLPCVAVPGSGLDESVLYPRTHVTLARRIIESGGALLSEFEPMQRAAPWTFPQRNRIMAGMAHATLLIEATERSGTLITARLASDYNRELLAVPGSIFSEHSHGTHQFIKLGATPVTSPSDILNALGIAEHTSATPPTLTPEELMVWDALHEPNTSDALVQILNIPIQELQTTLTLMEINGHIVEHDGLWRRNKSI